MHNVPLSCMFLNLKKKRRLLLFNYLFIQWIYHFWIHRIIFNCCPQNVIVRLLQSRKLIDKILLHDESWLLGGGGSLLEPVLRRPVRLHQHVHFLLYRMKHNNTIRYNAKRRHWRRTKLKLQMCRNMYNPPSHLCNVLCMYTSVLQCSTVIQVVSLIHSVY